ncbi:MAG: acyltransferase, partial [Acidimicrobiales bacterium]
VIESQVELAAVDGSWIELHDVVLKTGALVRADHGGRLSIGRGIVGRGTVIVAVDSIDVGSDCWIAEMVVIRDHDHVRRPDGMIDPDGLETDPIVIGSRVWLGAKCTVLKGVTIGDGATVAAGAVVTRDVRAGATVAGVPARPIG